MNEIFNAEDVVFAESVLNDAVVGERDTLLVDLAISALVDQLTDGLQVGFTKRKISDQSIGFTDNMDSNP